MNAAQIITRTRTVLGDAAGIKFSDAQLETALSQVLAMVNVKVPHMVTLEFSQTVDQRQLTLVCECAIRDVLRVEYLNDGVSRCVDFSYDPDQAMTVQILDDVEAGIVLNWRVKLVSDHQIEGLDGAGSSTIPNSCEMLMASGTAAQALQMRNTQLAESANQENDRTQVLQQLSHAFDEQFQNLLIAWQSAQPAILPVLPDGEGWQLD